jgi:hypothetical protein
MEQSVPLLPQLHISMQSYESSTGLDPFKTLPKYSFSTHPFNKVASSSMFIWGKHLRRWEPEGFVRTQRRGDRVDSYYLPTRFGFLIPNK